MQRTLTIVPYLLGSVLLAAVTFTVPADPDVYPDDYGNNYDRGKTFYQKNVLPRLAENDCLKCHARGYVRPNVTVYEELLRRLAIGDSAVNNAVIYKIANIRSISPMIPNHPGGQRCSSIDAEPCKSIRQWWEIEFGQKEAGK